MQVDLAYGKTGLRVELPERNVKHVLQLPDLPPVAEPEASTLAALTQPIGTPPLAQVAAGRRDAVIVVSDLTRPVPNSVLLPPMLEILTDAGLRPADIVILVATGLHRANTEAELTEMLGTQVMGFGCRIENHDARNLSEHRLVGTTDSGCSASVDVRYLDADLRILTGLVEPHLMAGYSGGRKSICPGICDADSIMAFHRPELIEDDRATAGNLDDNPVDAEISQVAQMAGGADFIVNVTINARRQVTGVFAGDMAQAHGAAVERAYAQSAVTIPEPTDVVISCGGGYPLDLVFYQGIKGMDAANRIVRDGGTIIMAQENSHGVGGPEFTETMLAIDDLHALVQQALAEDMRQIDLWQIHQSERIQRRARVMNYSTGVERDIQSRLFVTPIESVEQGVALCLEHYGPDMTIAVMPDGPYLLPFVQQQ
jgi:nickel-dependent lactate racemase